MEQDIFLIKKAVLSTDIFIDERPIKVKIKI